MVTDIKNLKKKKLKNPILFVGLPGIGLVGKISVDYLVTELKPKPVLMSKVFSDAFPPAVHARNSVMELISDEIYLYSTKTRDYLFLVGPVQPALNNTVNGEIHYEFSEKLASYFSKIGVKKIYTFAGLNIGDKRIETKKPKVLVVSTSDNEKTKLQKKKIKNLYFEKDNKDTLISGVAGLLPAIAMEKYKIPGVCLMGETNGKLAFGDHGSAKEILEIIKVLFKLKINLKKIDESAKKIKDSFSEISKGIEQISKKEAKPTNYIR